MSKYSEIVNGRVLDWKFVDRETDTVFYVGDIIVGTIYKLQNWTAVSYYENRYGPIRGFASRTDAAEYLLQVFRLHKNTIGDSNE